MDKVLEKNIFKIDTYGNISKNRQIFKSYFIDKIKHASTDKAYEKI